MKSPENQFLHERNPKLHASPEVEAVVDYLRAGGERIPNEPTGKISAHLGFLGAREYANDGILTGDQNSIERQIGAHVIKKEDVPEGYFELQRRIAREQGHGDIEITSEMRNEAQRIISADQRHSLQPWAEYLSGDDAGYPDWFKMYAFDNVLKMGKFDKQKDEFQKRSNSTTVTFPELRRGALSQVYTWVKEAKVDNKEIAGVFDDSEKEKAFQKSLKNGIFAKLYVHAIHKTQEGVITPEQKKEIEGSWKKYVQNSDPSILHGDLQGHGLDWCTAAGYETAVTHVRGGDFYVYYTRDEDSKDTVPRIAIRMEQGEVAEVRGINPEQELEQEMVDIAAEQLEDLPGGEEYIRRAEDMKRLTLLDKKTYDNPDIDLSSEEVRFLYELDREIQGFGYEQDPRINEIRRSRNYDQDKPELTRVLPEVIRQQVESAYVAYKTVTEQLGAKEISPDYLEHMFNAKDKEWQDSGVYDYLVMKLTTMHNVRYNLVVTPNVAASEAQIVALAEAFGKDQPYETYVDDKLYRQGSYTGSELSGNSGDAPIRLSLIPSRWDDGIGIRNVDSQRQALRNRQTSRPELHARVPSLLDAVTYWYTLRAKGDKLDDSNAYDKTVINHLDLEPKTVETKHGGLLTVPGSCVDHTGRPLLGSSKIFTRLAVG